MIISLLPSGVGSLKLRLYSSSLGCTALYRNIIMNQNWQYTFLKGLLLADSQELNSLKKKKQ